MPDDTNQIAGMLDYLRTQRDLIDEAIRALEALAALAPMNAFAAAVPATTTKPGDSRIESDSFFRMSISDAVKKYLGLVKKPKKTREILDGLLAGGWITTSKKPIAPLYNTLLVMENRSEIARVGEGTWGLAEWYGGRGIKKKAEKQAQSTEDASDDSEQ